MHVKGPSCHDGCDRMVVKSPKQRLETYCFCSVSYYYYYYYYYYSCSYNCELTQLSCTRGDNSELTQLSCTRGDNSVIVLNVVRKLH
jgi:hypothetical protein